MIRMVAVVGVLAFLAGCGDGTSTCTGSSCPDVSGSFNLFSVQPTGSCSFESYLPPPTLVLAQTGDMAHVTTQFIDPINQVLVPLRGDVLAADQTTNTGAFHMRTQALRQATQADAKLLTLQLEFVGSVTRTFDGASLSATLTITQLQPDPGAGCSMTMPISGRSTTP
jgi:hypothetical protein